ncbi:hypothetical protein CYLTODRAFT_469015 [Cylindrobasidium torrendii FP15055 ss-10]|uniref:Uncharacterized protein n=1 Tax=Cylindrobasidium torrendii FP15055 ss-10 TaxID=1314674 RepID=A0A0D7BMH1_9AGAR|nr:hypothetical protein CYLTODRAFT_469015 [Cylindrobasidium torrendii FP15055 ss-10]
MYRETRARDQACLIVHTQKLHWILVLHNQVLQNRTVNGQAGTGGERRGMAEWRNGGFHSERLKTRTLFTISVNAMEVLCVLCLGSRGKRHVDLQNTVVGSETSVDGEANSLTQLHTGSRERGCIDIYLPSSCWFEARKTPKDIKSYVLTVVAFPDYISASGLVNPFWNAASIATTRANPRTGCPEVRDCTSADHGVDGWLPAAADEILVVLFTGAWV